MECTKGKIEDIINAKKAVSAIPVGLKYETQ
jgi:hypothetical protein